MEDRRWESEFRRPKMGVRRSKTGIRRWGSEEKGLEGGNSKN